MRLLHARHDHDRGDPAREESEALRRRHPPRSRGQPLPLHGLPEHRRRRPRGRGAARPGVGGSMAKNAFGSPVKRREDPRLLTGQAMYTDDFTLPGMAHMAVVRSPYAHARIKAIRTKKA